MNQAKCRNSFRSGLAAVAACVASVAIAAPAQAQESAYCQKVRARAAADSALLFAPSVRVEGVKLPSAIQPRGGLDATAQTGAEYQLRAGGALNLINVYKGTRVVAVADADCAQHEATMTAQELLAQAPDFGRLAALRSQVQFLDSRQAAWEAITTKMSERFAAQSSTLLNVEDVRARASLIARRRAQLGGEVSRIEATGLEGRRGKVSALIHAVETTAMSYEREVSHLRSLDAWDLNLTGGYVPPVLNSDRNDFFAVVQVSYNLGGPWHTSAEGRYLRARGEELKTARYETHRQLRIFREQMKGAIVAAKQELAIVDKNLAALRADRVGVEGSDAPLAAYATAMLDLELISGEADQLFLTAYIRGLSHVEEN